MSSADIEDPGHGNSPAAWIAVAIMLVAVIVGTIAFRWAIVWLVWAAAILALLGLITGWVLKRLGYGVGGGKWAQKVH
jgi:NhaP-type Na+/H+ or K+/H+ antiporter